MHAWFAVPASPAVAGSGVPLDRYLVFCKLLRAGYIVQASWGGGGGGGGAWVVRQHQRTAVLL